MESLLPFTLFAFVASVTPGPTNVLVLANASRHGLIAALPMVAGAAAGAASVLLLVSTGLARPLAAHQGIRILMAAAGLAWLTVLAVQLLRAAPQLPDAADANDRRGRLGLIGTAGLQWINPKAWMMALAATGVFADGSVPMLALSGVFFVVALPCVLVWAGMGAGAARWIRNPAAMAWFNRGMALLLLFSAWAAVFW